PHTPYSSPFPRNMREGVFESPVLAIHGELDLSARSKQPETTSRLSPLPTLPSQEFQRPGTSLSSRHHTSSPSTFLTSLVQTHDWVKATPRGRQRYVDGNVKQ